MTRSKDESHRSSEAEPPVCEDYVEETYGRVLASQRSETALAGEEKR